MKENIYEDSKIKIPKGHPEFDNHVCNAVKNAWNNLMDQMAITELAHKEGEK